MSKTCFSVSATAMRTYVYFVTSNFLSFVQNTNSKCVLEGFVTLQMKSQPVIKYKGEEETEKEERIRETGGGNGKEVKRCRRTR